MSIDYRSIRFDDSNPATRVPCVLLLDTSLSMGQPSGSGSRIDGLNRALAQFASDLSGDTSLKLSLEISIVTFGPVAERTGFVSGSEFVVLPLIAEGPNTPMASAIHFALDKLQERKVFYKGKRVSYHQPWLVLITDGEPTDPGEIPGVAQRLRDLEAAGKLVFIAAGIDDADFDTLKLLSVRPVVSASGSNLVKLFEWLGASLSVKSVSRPGEQTPLPPLNMGTA